LETTSQEDTITKEYSLRPHGSLIHTMNRLGRVK